MWASVVYFFLDGFLLDGAVVLVLEVAAPLGLLEGLVVVVLRLLLRAVLLHVAGLAASEAH